MESQAFDQLLSLRPQEPPDSRLLVVTVTEDDVEAQAQEQRRGSLSDKSLSKLLEKLEGYQPTVMGLDIYRDYAVGKDYPTLAARMQKSDRLISVINRQKLKLYVKHNLFYYMAIAQLAFHTLSTGCHSF